VLREITWEQYAHRCLAVEQAVARVLAGGRGVDDTIVELLAEMARLTEIVIGEYWEPDGTAEQLHCRCFHPPRLPGTVGDLKRYFDNVPLSTEDTLLGEVWRRRQPVWLTDVQRDRRFSRLAEATELGLNTALAFPVLDGERALGVIALYTRERLPEVAPFPAMLLRVGRDIGQFLQRTAAEQATREREARLRQRGDELALMLDSAPLALALVDRRQRLLRANEAFTALLEQSTGPHLGEPVDRLGGSLGEALRPVLQAVIDDTGASPARWLTVHDRQGRPEHWRLGLRARRDDAGQVVAVACSLQAPDDDG
jgi:PAS domain-containing protein